MRKELLKGLTDEQIKKVEECKNSDEILALAKEEGVVLNDEQLEAVSGGGCFGGGDYTCPECGATGDDVVFTPSSHYQ
ncbi:MAG TPA: hypothetical protein DCR12_05930, partial [Lachnospiraceae bacterium]|nr:hypothetical protein [Lachnospiraceae bacterium]